VEVRIQTREVDSEIRFVEQQSLNSWQQYAPNEYGSYANVNPPSISPLELGDRTTHRRVLPAQDADVQRLRGPSAVAVRWNGFAKKLLMFGRAGCGKAR
jgi:hypothetical protein